jgi:hypothetical protein
MVNINHHQPARRNPGGFFISEVMSAGYPTRNPLCKAIPTPMDTDRIKREAWERDGLLVVDVNDARLNEIERGFLLAVGNRITGAKTVKA